MGKKKIRSKKISNGQRRNVAKWVCKAVAKDKPVVDTWLDKLQAWKEGKDPWITAYTHDTNRRKVRVKANKVMGNPKTSSGVHS